MMACSICVLLLGQTNGFLSKKAPPQFPHQSTIRDTTDEDCKDSSLDSSSLWKRRDLPTIIFQQQALVSIPSIALSFSTPTQALMSNHLTSVIDPHTYPALIYSNPQNNNHNNKKKVPLLIILHGAGKNQDGVWNLANPKGEHAGLLPSLIATNRAPTQATENFVIVAPYAIGKRSFYEDPRSKLLQFIDWVCYSKEAKTAGIPENIDTNRIFLFGFSDGATVAVELATTRRFKACIICAYGYSGLLPSLALDRLRDIPFWIFHSADDVIFPVRYGDQLLQSLRSVNKQREYLIRYSRYNVDQEGFTGDVRGHSVGITASKLPEIYDWMLSIS